MGSRPVLSLDAIHVVDAIARRGSFAKAAAELHKVPSALSYTVNQLERELGVRLFERSRSHTRLTPAGQDLLEEGRRLLQLAAAAERRLGRIASLRWRPVRGCVSPRSHWRDAGKPSSRTGRTLSSPGSAPGAFLPGADTS